MTADVVDPVDLLVPRPHSKIRMLLVGLLAVGAVCVVGLLSSSGALAPRVSVDGSAGATWIVARGRVGPRLSFELRNNGPYQITIRSIDGRIPGLSGVSYLFTRSSVANGPTAESRGGQAAIPARTSLEVTLEYVSVDCGRISNITDSPIPITMTNLLGISLRKSVVPIVFYQTTLGYSLGVADTSSAGRVNWPEALTWSACRRAGTTPVPSISLAK